MTTRYTKKFTRYLRNSKAISALEYAILLGVISVALVAALNTFSGSISTAIQKIAGNIDTEAAKVGKAATSTSSSSTTN